MNLRRTGDLRFDLLDFAALTSGAIQAKPMDVAALTSLLLLGAAAARRS